MQVEISRVEHQSPMPMPMPVPMIRFDSILHSCRLIDSIHSAGMMIRHSAVAMRHFN